MKHPILTTSLLSSILFSACAPSPQSSPETQNTELKKLVIGYQKSSLSAITLKSEPVLLQQHFPNTHIEWKEFPAGPQLLEALSVGAVDVGSVGNTPPLFAQSGQKNLAYVAYEKYHPQALGLLVHQDSNIDHLTALKGKRIALQRGSNAHDLLDKILQKAHLTWQDIQPIWLSPADARAAFEQKTVDAWLIWEPFQSVALQGKNARLLSDATPFAPSYSFSIGNPEFLKQHPKAVTQYIAAANAAAHWVTQHPQQAVQLYSQAIGITPELAEVVLKKRYQPTLLHPMTPDVIQTQQQIADRFSAEKLIPKPIKVAEFVYLPRP